MWATFLQKTLDVSLRGGSTPGNNLRADRKIFKNLTNDLMFADSEPLTKHFVIS